MTDVVIVSAARTPIGALGGSLKDVTAVELGTVAAKAAIEGKVVEISAKVSESGKLFGGVSAEKIAQALAASVVEAGSVEARSITVENIKTTGEYPVTVKLHPEISANFTVKVVAE